MRGRKETDKFQVNSSCVCTLLTLQSDYFQSQHIRSLYTGAGEDEFMRLQHLDHDVD